MTVSSVSISPIAHFIRICCIEHRLYYIMNIIVFPLGRHRTHFDVRESMNPAKVAMVIIMKMVLLSNLTGQKTGHIITIF